MFEVGAVRKGKAHKMARISVMLGVILVMSAVGMAITAAAPDPCQDVWEGVTQSEPLQKVADPSTAFPGDEVTYTFTWHSTGAPEASLEDCYRVGDGSDASLNGLVSGFYHAVDIPNVGDNGDLQTYEYTITIPDDSDLIGHTVVNRAKMTKGSVESRTALIAVTIVAPPCTSNCGDPTPDPTVDPTPDPTVDPTPDPTVDPTVDPTPDPTDGGSDTVVDNNSGGQGDEVLGRTVERKALAQTGPETTVLAWFGLALLMVGAALRFGRFGTRAALATGSPASDELVARTLALVERTVRGGSRNWTCGG